ncbi:PepSY-associated TM helix domain-containing protein [Salisaeta longa]|uniref:PepSY-associated TM helix domain-containing protein n=1 Tax=Salisaeta longa TaxID=503170 RepID=UPI0003B40BD7|nr:PepSY-associated TM helix domain-containing protein [Salisaeta longa]
MNIGRRTYTLMWDAHSVTGLVIGLALFVLFFTGALVLFRGEIRQWEEPALRTVQGPRQPLDALVTPVLDSLGKGQQPPSYVLMEMPTEHAGTLYLYAAGNTHKPSHTAWVNPVTGAWVSPPTGADATQTLYYLHFFYQLGRWGLYLTGFVGLFMLLAILTGTVVHWKRLVKDFFRFRPSKKLRVAWADAHKVLGTLGLPFQALFAFTGAYMGLLGLLALPYAALLYDGQPTQMYRDAGYYGPAVTVDSAAIAPAGLPRLQAFVARTERQWTDFEVTSVIASGLGTPTARVEVIGERRGAAVGGTGALVFHRTTGRILARRAPTAVGPLNSAVQTMERLHFAAVGGRALDLLFLLLALASCVVILTGNFTWLEARKRQDRWTHALMARATAGVATGLLPATALLFLAMRFLPTDAAPALTAGPVFFGGWALALLYALAQPNVARTHRQLLIAGGGLALLLPLVNGWMTGDWLWTVGRTQRWSTWGVDVGAVCAGHAALAGAAWIDTDPADEAPAPPSQRNGRRPHEVTLQTAP